MKNNLLIVLILIATNALGQNDKPKTIINDSVFKKLHLTQFIIDGGYITGEIKGSQMQGGTLSFGVVFNQIWNTGLSFDFMTSRNILIDNPLPVINPRYSYSCFLINNEFIIGNNKIITAAIPVRFGLGYTEFFDKYVDNNQHQTIADDVFFVSEIGATFYFNFLKSVSLGGGIKYRWATDVQRIGTNEDYRNYTIEAKIRFRFLTNADKTKSVPQGNDL